MDRTHDKVIWYTILEIRKTGRSKRNEEDEDYISEEKLEKQWFAIKAN